MRFTVLACQVFASDAHGGLMIPATWMNKYGATPLDGGKQTWNSGTDWFMNWTFVPAENDLKLALPADGNLNVSPRGYGLVNGNPNDYWYSRRHPWIAPGRAPIDSPCGIKGGNKRGCFTGNGFGLNNPAWGPFGTTVGSGNQAPCAGGGSSEGIESLTSQSFTDYFQSPATTYWRVGTPAETGWGVVANHGGGYTYRLCEVPSFDPADIIQTVTENCFQANPVSFHGTKQWLKHKSDGPEQWTELDAVEISGNDVFPANSHWRKNPIPACNGYSGGSDGQCAEAWFESPIPNLFGFGNVDGTLTQASDYLIMDKLQVPNTPGKFVLGWRYDCEQTPQVWLGCANIQILGENDPEPTHPPGYTPPGTSCICPSGQVLDGDAIFLANQVVPSGPHQGHVYDETCSMRDSGVLQYTQSATAIAQGHTCALIASHDAATYAKCCIDPVSEPEPEPEDGGIWNGNIGDIAAGDAEPEPEPEPEPEEPEVSTHAKAGCICNSAAEFTPQYFIDNPVGNDYTCETIANWVVQHRNDVPCNTIRAWYREGGNAANPLWSSVCCGSALMQVGPHHVESTLNVPTASTKFAGRVGTMTAAMDAAGQIQFDES